MTNRCTSQVIRSLFLTCLIIVLSTSAIRVANAQNASSPLSPMDHTIKSLCDQLENQQEPRARLNAVIRLQSYGPDAMSAKDYLKKALNPQYASDAEVRMTAALALRDFEKKADDSVDQLIEALNDKDAYVRANAADALGSLRSAQAVRSLVPLLDEKDPHVRGTAAYALYGIWFNAEAAGTTDIPSAVEKLRSLLHDREISVRTNAAAALGAIGPDSRSATDDLIRVLDDDPMVQEWAAFALGRVGSDAKKSSPILIRLLKYNDEQGKAVAIKAAEALGQLGPKEAIPPLTQLLNDPDPDVYRTAAKALDDLANRLYLAGETEAIGPLQKALNSVRDSRDLEVTKYSPRIQQSIADLESLQWQHVLQRYKWFLLGAAIVLGWFLVCLGLLWIYPLGLLRINDALSDYLDIKLPAWLGGITIPVRYALLVGFFHYHRRVLDAWVAQYLDTARKRFSEKPTIQERDTHIPVPVVFNKKNVANISPAELRPAFSENISYFLICGEGGSGKTSLACCLAKWAMSNDADERLHRDHPILPVFVEPEIEVPSNAEDFLLLVNDHLRGLTDRLANAPGDLLRNLLKQRRVMLVIDGFSEMSQPTRKAYLNGIRSAPANAVIFTSRASETLDGIPKNTIEPLRINGKQLSSFMDAYLVHRGKRSLFDDQEFFDYCGRLSSIVGERDITALLAKYYGEQMIAAKEGTIESDLPNNIPDLMVTYIDILYRQPPDAPDIREVIRGAEVVAWECLRKTYTPMPGNREEVLASLGGPEKGLPIIDYLEETLKITKTVGALRNQVRFVFDPLSEYLAGLYLLEQYRNDEGKWRGFLADADKKESTPNSIRSFLLALRDCCLSKGADYDVPHFMGDELARRAGLNLP